MQKALSWRPWAVVIAGVMFAAVAMLPVAANAHGSEREDRGRPADVEQRVQERRAQAQANVEEKREMGQQKSQEARQAACERRADKIGEQMHRLSDRADHFLSVFDSFYDRVQGFYESGQLTDPNYDELTQTVDEARENAAAEVEALSLLEVKIDCEDPDVAVNVGAFRDSVHTAREAIHEYRAALVDLVSSLRAEAAEENAENETDGETESETETESQTENEAEGTEPEETETEEETTNES